MTSFTLENLQAMKRKDLIALCKEQNIKCVGKVHLNHWNMLNGI